MSSIPRRNAQWQPPPARLEGDRLLKEAAAAGRFRTAGEILEEQRANAPKGFVSSVPGVAPELPDYVPSELGALREKLIDIAKDVEEIKHRPAIGGAVYHRARVSEASVQNVVNGAIGVTIQAYSANLDEYAGVNPTAAGLALLDDADAVEQRDTLGLGTAAITDAADYATAAQGGLADTAMQPATYDPTAVGGDAFAMDNMVEGATTKILTAAERAIVADAVTKAGVETITGIKTFTTASANTAPVRIESSDAGSAFGPLLNFARTSATPAANDYIGSILFRGMDNGANELTYAFIRSQILDPTDASEDGSIQFVPTIAGAPTQAMSVANGVLVGPATGSYQGNGTINATGYYLNGANIVVDEAADRTALLALDTTVHPSAKLTEAGRAGDFVWRGSDLSSTLLGSTITSSAVNSTTETITSTAHGLQTGQAVIATTAVNGLSLNTLYYAILVDANNFRLASSPANALAGTAFNLTGTTNFSVRRHYDPAQAIYVTPTADITGASGAWVRIHSGRLDAAWANAIGDDITDNSLAFLSLFGLNEKFNWPIEFGPGMFRCAIAVHTKSTSLSLSGSGNATGGTALVFGSGNGILLAQASRHDGFNLYGMVILSSVAPTGYGFGYSNATSTGGRSSPRSIDLCTFAGYDYWIDQGVTPTGKTQGWLRGVSIDEGDGTVICDSDVIGNWNNLPSFGTVTYGFWFNNSTQTQLTNCRVWSVHTGAYSTGQAEGFALDRFDAAGVHTGVNFDPTTGPANEFIMVNSHANFYKYGVRISPNFSGSAYHQLRGCFIYKNPSTALTGCIGVEVNGKAIITENHFLSDGAVAGGDISIDWNTAFSGGIVTNNHFSFSNVVIDLAASSSDVVVVGNTTTDDAGTLAVAPVVDAGSLNTFYNNGGDRINLWPSPRFTAKSVTALNAEAKSAGKIAVCTNETGGATLVFADGTNWRRVTDRAVMS